MGPNIITKEEITESDSVLVYIPIIYYRYKEYRSRMSNTQDIHNLPKLKCKRGFINFVLGLWVKYNFSTMTDNINLQIEVPRLISLTARLIFLTEREESINRRTKQMSSG